MVRKRTSSRPAVYLTLACILIYLASVTECELLRDTDSNGTKVTRVTGLDLQEGKILFGIVVDQENAETALNAPIEDGSYQADSTGWSTGQMPDSLKAAWKRMALSLHCGRDRMRFRAVGPGVSRFLLDRGRVQAHFISYLLQKLSVSRLEEAMLADMHVIRLIFASTGSSPLPLNQIPTSCGSSLQRNLGLVIVIAYDCCLVHESGSYFMPMRWQGIQISLLCPKPTVTPSPPCGQLPRYSPVYPPYYPVDPMPPVQPPYGQLPYPFSYVSVDPAPTTPPVQPPYGQLPYWPFPQYNLY